MRTGQGAKALWLASLISKRNLRCFDPWLQADNMLAGCTWLERKGDSTQ